MIDTSIMPRQLMRVKVFTHRAEVTVKDGQWVVTGGDPGTLETMVNDWITGEKAQVKDMSSPSVNVYARDNVEQRLVFTSITICYLAAVEQHNEQSYGRQAGTGQLSFAPPGTDPNNTAISTKTTTDGVSAGNGVRGTSAFPNVGRS